jgi:hypothetical protein
MYGAYWRPHDVRGAADATPAVRAFVHDFFRRAWQASGTDFLVEKTPSNCFRVPFLKALFPRARFIHIIRDGRAVAYSSVRAFLGEDYVSNADRRAGRRTPMQRLRYLLQRWPEVPRRLHERDLPPSGWLPYLVRKGGEMLQVVTARKPPVWGARYPGIYADRDAYTPLEVAGIQWRESVARAMADLAMHVPADGRFSLRYERLLDDPPGALREIFDFLGHDVDPSLLERARERVKSDGEDMWKSGLDGREHAALMPHIAPLLATLGYAPAEEVPWLTGQVFQRP